MDNLFVNNRVEIGGEIVSGFRYSHEICGEKFYLFDLKVDRLSDSFDIVPVMISERLINVKENLIGSFLNVSGQFRSFNRKDGEKTHLVLSVFARAVEFIEENNNTNSAFFEGYVCKPTSYRKTPLGREIADVLIAVNRPYGKSDYIPCVFWGRNAKFASGFYIGEHIKVWGRVQSREYQKRISEIESETRTAYELSINKVEVVKGV